MRKTLPTGTDNFREIIKGNQYYIDKTLLIRDFLRLQDKAALITRPRRFGKTLNLSMLEAFFDITQDSRDIFAGLDIMETEYADQINSRPVISLTFKNCESTTFEELKRDMLAEVFKAYKKYEPAVKEKVADLAQNDTHQFFEMYAFLRARRADHFMAESLYILIEMLSIVYEQKPLVLIDEYDKPIEAAYTNGHQDDFTPFYNKMFNNALKTNPHLGQVLLTGVQRVAKTSSFSGLNHFAMYTVFDHHYHPYFGLTEHEVETMLADFDMVLCDEVRHFYNGYRFSGMNMYNPWSLLFYVQNRSLEPYWIGTSTNKLIKEALLHATEEFLEDFDQLITKGYADVYINLSSSFMELNRTDVLWGMLINAGYLTTEERFAYDYVRVRFPNKEVVDEVRKMVADNALKQIIDNRNYTAFAGDVLCIGIAHDKKVVHLAHKVISVND